MPFSAKCGHSLGRQKRLSDIFQKRSRKISRSRHQKGQNDDENGSVPSRISLSLFTRLKYKYLLIKHWVNTNWLNKFKLPRASESIFSLFLSTNPSPRDIKLIVCASDFGFWNGFWVKWVGLTALTHSFFGPQALFLNKVTRSRSSPPSTPEFTNGQGQLFLLQQKDTSATPAKSTKSLYYSPSMPIHASQII